MVMVVFGRVGEIKIKYLLFTLHIVSGRRWELDGMILALLFQTGNDKQINELEIVMLLLPLLWNAIKAAKHLTISQFCLTIFVHLLIIAYRLYILVPQIYKIGAVMTLLTIELTVEQNKQLGTRKKQRPSTAGVSRLKNHNRCIVASVVVGIVRT